MGGELTGLEEQEKEEYAIWSPSGVEGRERSCYRLLLLHDKSKGINRKNKHHVQYSDVPSAIKPIPHSPDLPVSEPDVTMESSSDSESSGITDTAECSSYKPEEVCQPIPLTQAELNDLTRDLNLSQEFAQLLGSRLREKRLLAPGTTSY